MIPNLNKNGYLPAGLHKATLSEIKQRFGSNSEERKELFKGLQSLTQLLRKHKKHIKEFLVNGSFVTDKKVPKDFDCILVIKNGFDFNSPESKQLMQAKKLFNAHLFIFLEEDKNRYYELMDFFGHDNSFKSKGLVEVIL